MSNVRTHEELADALKYWLDTAAGNTVRGQFWFSDDDFKTAHEIICRLRDQGGGDTEGLRIPKQLSHDHAPLVKHLKDSGHTIIIEGEHGGTLTVVDMNPKPVPTPDSEDGRSLDDAQKIIDDYGEIQANLHAEIRALREALERIADHAERCAIAKDGGFAQIESIARTALAKGA